jgi:hypothetical protein
MGQVLVRGVADRAVRIIKARARERGTSLQAELKEIIEREAELEAERRRWLREMDAIARIAGRQRSESARLVREDRRR